MWKVMLCLSLISIAAGEHGQLEMCSELDINYENKLIGFGNVVRFDCDLQGSSFQWWRSNSRCGDFVPYDVCTSTNCDVMVDDSIQRYFYYCCTPEGTSAISSQSTNDCFHIQICTEITSTGPDVAFFGSSQNISVSMYAEPPPPSIIPDVQLEYSNKSISLPADAIQGELVSLGQDVTLLVWVYTVQVKDVEMNVSHGRLVFMASYERVDEFCSSTLGASHINYNIPVARSNRQQSTPATSETVTTEPIQPLSVVDCTSQTLVAVILPLILLIIMTVSLVANCVCGICYCKNRGWFPSSRRRSRPQNLGYHTVPAGGSAASTPLNQTHTPLTTIHEEVEEPPTLETSAPLVTTPSTPNLPLPDPPYERVHDNPVTDHVYDSAGSRRQSNSAPEENKNDTATEPLQNGNGTELQASQNGNETEPNPTPDSLVLENKQSNVAGINTYAVPMTSPVLEENIDSKDMPV